MAGDVIFWFGEYYRSKGDSAKAREYFNSLLQKYPSGALAGEAMYQLALIMADEGKPDEAAALFEKLAATFPGSESGRAALRKMARMKKDAGDFSAAIGYYRKVLTPENTEMNAQIQYEIAEACEAQGDLRRAAEEYLKVPYLYGKGAFWSVKAQMKCAQAFERLGSFDEARKVYEKLVNMGISESDLARKRLEWIKWRSDKDAGR
jgi:TolA-binding protein